MRLSIEGDLDLATRDLFMERVAAALRESPSVELDLRAVRAIDSVGLAAIRGADRLVRDSGGEMTVLLAEDGPVRRMFELTLLHLTMQVRTG